VQGARDVSGVRIDALQRGNSLAPSQHGRRVVAEVATAYTEGQNMDRSQSPSYSNMSGSFAKLAEILDVVGQAIIIKDEASRFVHLNAQACALLHAPLEHVLGRTDHDFLPKAEADSIRAMDLDILRSGAGRTFEETITAADGATHTLVTRKHAITLPDVPGKVVVAVISDVTALRTAENVLRASEEHYRSLVELHPQIPWIADPSGAMTEVGPGWLEVTGTSPERALGTAWQDALHPDDLAAVAAQWRESVRAGTAFDVECRLGNPSEGRYRWFRNRAAARKDADNKVVRWYGLLEDVHQQRIATDALRESESLFRLIADSVPVMMWLTDAQGNATYHSRQWLELTGQTAAEALGFGWSVVVHPDDRSMLLDAFERATRDHAQLQIEYRLRRANGEWAWVIDTGAPRLSDDGELLGYAGSVLDITERRAAEVALRDSEAAIRSIFDSSPDCIRMLDLEGKPMLMNKAGRAIWGLGPTDPVADLTWRKIVCDGDRPRLISALELVRGGGTARLDLQVTDALGSQRCMDVVAAPVLAADGVPTGIVTIWRDITEAKTARVDAELAQRQAEAAASRLSVVLDSTMDAVLVVDRTWRVRYMNENALRLLGLDDSAIGADLWDLYPDEVDGPFHNHYRRALDTGRPVSFEEYVSSLKMWLEVHASPTEDGLSIFFRDTSARREAEQERFQAQKQIYHMSRHDALTALPNRVLFRDTVEQHLNRVDPDVLVGVLTLDLDGFKSVNDAYGHHAGDVLLRQVAERLTDCVGSENTVARLGGDEFAICMPALRDAAESVDMARRLVAAVSEPFDLEGIHVSIGTSVGIAITPEDGDAVDQITKASDVALYRAKAMGRGTFCRYVKGMDADIQSRQALKLSLRQALIRGEFELHYQPIVNLGSDHVTTCEALVRWRHPEKGMISPADFIPLAEETGAIVQIGEWVLRQACEQAATWPDEVSVAVNLSPIQFKSGDLLTVVKNSLRDSGIAAARLQLEITESVLLDEVDANLRTLQQIRQLGVKIAMDDFGTGYSSLGYLRSFPFDKIKVDRSFISDLPNGRESLAIVRAVASIGRSLGITTTVEGVETHAQLDAVNVEGFDEAQGYLFARPILASEVRQLIESRQTRSDLPHPDGGPPRPPDGPPIRPRQP
jgi:diguanylate cyclase (GGDEF)-like protein/PAS domain S-box-containing protein